MMKRIKIAVTGAAGQIGYAFLFRLASGQVFGDDTQVDLHLLEIEPALPTLKGVAMELEDCAFPTLGNIVMTSDPARAMKDINWATLIGSVPRKQGMERSDLLKINGGIFIGQGRAINENANSDVRVFVVGNPCNTNCLIAMNNAPDVPNDRFFAMTMLDENRAVSQLAQKANVHVNDVQNMIIWGNHSATQFPDYFNAEIKGKKVPDVISDHQWLKNDFIPIVQKRGAAVIEARGSSSAASAANGIVDGLKALVYDTKPLQSYSMCRASQGEYGVDAGLIYSFPTRTENGKITVVPGIQHSEFAQEKLRITLEELRAEYQAVKELGLLPE